MRAAVICFTANGLETALRIRRALEKKPQAETSVWCKKKDVFLLPEWGVLQIDEPLQDWTGRRFADSQLLIFVGATGIAVRAAAPHLAGKQYDPAVLCVDEKGTFVISLLSGHIGGANELTAALAAELEAVPVITTATDLNGKFAVDVFARANDLWISDMSLAKEISAALLDGIHVGFISEVPVAGPLPEGLEKPGDPMLPQYRRADFSYEGDMCDVLIRVTNPLLRMNHVPAQEETMPGDTDEIEKAPDRMKELCLVPRCITLGVGCRKDKDPEEFSAGLHKILRTYGIDLRAVRRVCSIDLKAEEEAVLNFCRQAALPFETFTAEELLRTEGTFSHSSFVEKTTGVDSVCERSAVCGSGPEGFLVMAKVAENGMTAAAAGVPVRVSF